MTKELQNHAEKFARDHWKEIFTGTFASSVILLLIAYYKHQRWENGEEVEVLDLSLIEVEAHNPTQDEIGMLLETGTYAVDSIPQGDILAGWLARGLKGKAKEFMEALSLIGRKKFKK